ncbi:MAG TPA: TRAP transporter small permease [Burkholderiales bacterium]|nr:TRAP transporter small permease [Burkholderiales bacterium]
MSTHASGIDNSNDPVLGADGEFHVTDEPVDLSVYHFEDWIAFGFFWVLAATVFYQFFTRYALNDSASWTEEIARYLLICVVFIGAAIGVRKNTHIQVDIFYRFMPARFARILATLVDAVRVLFFGYAIYLTYALMMKIGKQQMAIIDWPIGLIYAVVMLGFTLMCLRAILAMIKHCRQGYSVLERPDVAGEEQA